MNNNVHWFLTLVIAGALIAPPQADADEAALLARVGILEANLEQVMSQLNIQAADSSNAVSPAVSPADKHIQNITTENYPWLEGLNMKGDVRLRMENFSQAVDRNRFRVRLRWGAEKTFGDDFKAGFRLASGSRDTAITDNADGSGNATESVGIANDPTSTNQTFDELFNLKDIFIDHAYGQYNPSFLEGMGPIRSVEIKAGKMAHPWSDYSTSIVWDGDVSPEGAYEKFVLGLYEGDGAVKDVSFTGLFGQWILGETGGQHGDMEMFSYTGAVETEFDAGLPKPATARAAFNFYDYVDIQDDIVIGSSSSVARNNTPGAGDNLGIEDWNIVQAYGEIKLPKVPVLFDQDVKLFTDWAHNTENSPKDGAAVNDERNAYSFGVKVGKAKRQGSWEMAYQYFRIEQNSVLAAFSESDIGAGGTDHRGNKFSGAYALSDHCKVNFSAWFVDDLSMGTTGSSAGRINRFQTDISWAI